VAVGGLLTVTPAQVSEAVAATGVNEALRLPVHSIVFGAGQVIVGFVVSTTFTVLVQLAVRFAASFAL